VGALVPWAQAKVGAVATQALANPTYGPQGLQMMQLGFSAEETLNQLINNDSGRDDRQVGLVDAKGHAATFTGKNCFDFAGGITGENFAVQGNILAGPAVIEAMAEKFQKTPGSLAERLLAALEAGEAAGGDRRGKESAALLVVQAVAAYGGPGTSGLTCAWTTTWNPSASSAACSASTRSTSAKPSNSFRSLPNS
jgi:uncharacterized Ntn-hydrolase superfamily protein